MSESENKPETSAEPAPAASASEPVAAAPAPAAPSKAPRKTQALTLLSGILEETQSEAEAERKRIDEQLKQKELEAKRRAEEEENARKAEAARKIAEEEARQKAASERRAMTARLLKVEERPENPAEAAPTAPVLPTPASISQVKSGYNTTQLVAVQRKAGSKGAFIGAAAAILLAAGGGAAYFQLTRTYVDAQTSFPKASPEFVSVASATVRGEWLAAPVAAAPVADAAADAAPEPARRPTGRRTSPRPADGGGSTGT